MANLKECTRCGRIKSLLQFYKSSIIDDGYENQCKECRKLKMRKQYKSDEVHRRKYLYQKEWTKKNPERARAISKRTRQKARMDVLIAYSGPIPRCACCGEKEIKFLQLDHINGGGTKERVKIGSGTSLYFYLRKKKYPPGYQILCANCNHAKGMYGECPHKTYKLIKQQ